MDYRQINNDLKSGAVNKAVPILLYGEERFLTDYYEKQLIALFSSRDDEIVEGGYLDLSVFYGAESDDEQIMAALDTSPMLLPTRIVVVKGHPDLSGKSGEEESAPGAEIAKSKKSAKGSLTEYIASIPETSRLVFSANKVNKTRTLYKAIAKKGMVYEFTRLDEADLMTFVKKRFRAMNAVAAPDVLDAFIYATGYLEKDSDRDLFTVENDVLKLTSYALAEGRTTVTQSDLEECLESMLRTDVFAMLDAISSGKKAVAVRLLENSLASGENVFRLLSLFTGHFEIMLGCSELGAEGHTPKEITQMLGEKSPWRVNKLMGFAQRFETAKLQDILLRLYETEKNIKSGNIHEKLALTVLLAQI